MRALVLSILILAGCSSPPLELSVDVRTDLIPGADFTQASVDLASGQGERIAPVTISAESSDGWLSGVRVADFRSVAPGESRVTASLLDPAGVIVASRAVDITITEDYALTIVLTADCIGRTCPSATDPATHTECLHGVCIDPRCGGSHPEGCGSLACETATDCVDRLECTASCIGGACACTSIPPGVDAGREDAGPCPGECTPGQMSDETIACGQCGEGTQMRSRMCGDDCRWGTFGEPTTCVTAATCTPGQTDRESRSCGNCDRGTQNRTRSCNTATCTWDPFGSWTTCSGGGTCAPGNTRDGCDPCGWEVCSNSCTWGSCVPRSGSQCLRIRPGTSGPAGNNWRCCGSSRWQFCLASCQWSADCAPCSGCGC